MSFKVSFSGSAPIPVRFGLEGVMPVTMGDAIVVGDNPAPGEADGYSRYFTEADWTPFATRWQLLIPAVQHKLGSAVVISVEGYDAGGYDQVLLDVRRLTNGDILLRADERFAGMCRLQKI